MSASLSRLQSFYGELKAPLLLHAVIKREFPGTVALFTSFTADAGLLLAMVAEIDPATPILFLGNGAHPPETLGYGRALCGQLGLTRLHPVMPDTPSEPLAETLDTLGILALITGRDGAGQQRIELDENGVFRIHPLVGWTHEARVNELVKRTIPPHPLGEKAGWESGAFAVETDVPPAAAPAIDWTV